MLGKLFSVFALIALLISAFAGPVRADDATPVAEPVTETPIEVPTMMPSLVPTDVPTVEATEIATDPTPSSTVISATSTIEPTVVPTSTTEATAVPTSTDVPPSISWSQPDPITCTIKRGNSSLHYGESVVYSCDASIDTIATGDMPSDLDTIWILQADYSNGPVTIRLPEGSTAELLRQDELPADIDARTRVRTPFDQQSIVFEVVVNRTSCAVGDAPVELTADPQFEHADGVALTRTDKPASRPFTLITTSAPNGQPTVHFVGPISFEALSVSSTGLNSTISNGTAELVIDGDWNPCTTWSMSLTGGVDSSEIAPILRVVSINDESIPGGVCDLSSPCAVLALPASGNAATPLVCTVQLQLVFDPHTPPGHFNVSVSASLDSGSGQP